MKSRFGRVSAALLGAVLIVSCATTRLHQEGIGDFDHGHYELGLEKLRQAAGLTGVTAAWLE